MSVWTPVVVLPNIDLQEPIEGQLAALVPVDDSRINSITEAHFDFGTFLSRFADTFGREIRPSILIVQPNVPESIFRADAISSFRDAIALSTIPYNCALKLRRPRGHHIVWSEYFAIYPWMISKDFDSVVGNTPALLGIDDISDFSGHSSPELFPASLNLHATDEPLLEELLHRWRSHYQVDNPAWSDTALFRSLNMAFRAAQMPAGTEMTFYDVGRAIALWVSAFEILVHPGEGGSANLGKVYELLDNVDWSLGKSQQVTHRSFVGRRQDRAERTNGCWIYGELYRVRNDFLHGNPVEPDQLRIESSGRNLLSYAAPLYRMALSAFLPLAWTTPVPSEDDPEAFGKYVADHGRFANTQSVIEEGLLTAHMTPREQT